MELVPGNPRVVGVLNLTPDSFFEKSRIISDPSHVVDAAGVLFRDGADIIELGGESTGPGSQDVPADEELRRVLSAVTAVRQAYPDAWIFIDTWKSSVARACLDAGADAINDVTAGRGDPFMMKTVAAYNAGYVIMHSKDSTPRTTVHDTSYDTVVKTVKNFLRDRTEIAVRSGITLSSIIVDPGLGHFISADPGYSYELLAHAYTFSGIAPVLFSPSRKSFLAGPSALPPSDRLWPTVAASCLATVSGASFIRTHDVGTVKSALSHIRGLPITA